MRTFGLFLVTLAVIIVIKIISKIRFRKRRLKTNRKLQAKLEELKFTPTKTILITDCRTLTLSNDEEKQRILIDADSKHVFLVDYAKDKFFKIHFGDIVDCEIFENSAIYSEGRRRRMKECCNSMKLIIKVNNMDAPQIAYDIVFSRRKIDKESNEYMTLRNGIQEVKTFFDVIKSEKTKKKRFIYCRYCGAKNHEESLKCESCKGNLK